MNSKINIEKLIQSLDTLGKNAQEVDESIKSFRMKIHELYWDLAELKRKKSSIPER